MAFANLTWSLLPVKQGFLPLHCHPMLAHQGLFDYWTSILLIFQCEVP